MTNKVKQMYRGSAGNLPASTWTSSSMTAGPYYSMVYANGLFVTPTYNGATALTSPDGITWTARTLPSTQPWQAIAYGAGVFVTLPLSTTSTAAASSPDGITWTARTNPQALNWVSIAYGNSTFAAIASASQAVGLSADGITWTTSSGTLPVSQTWTQIAFGNGLFVAVSSASSTAASSPDGVTWTSRTLPAASYNAVTFGNGQFVAVGNASGVSTCATSPDGITWTSRTMPSASVVYANVVYGGGVYVAASTSGGTCAVSVDGINWVSRNLAASTSYGPIAFGANTIVTLSIGGATAVQALTTVGPQTFYTAPTATTAIVTDLWVANQSVSTATFTLFVDGVPHYPTLVSIANSFFALRLKQTLTAGKTITGYSSQPVQIHVNGIEVT